MNANVVALDVTGRFQSPVIKLYARVGREVKPKANFRAQRNLQVSVKLDVLGSGRPLERNPAWLLNNA